MGLRCVTYVEMYGDGCGVRSAGSMGSRSGTYGVHQGLWDCGVGLME